MKRAEVFAHRDKRYNFVSIFAETSANRFYALFPAFKTFLPIIWMSFDCQEELQNVLQSSGKKKKKQLLYIDAYVISKST